MKKIIQGLLLLFLFTNTTSSFAEEIKISGFVPKFGFPKTGQTTSYYVGDDGTHEMGLPATGIAHYQDNFDGTITDNATGLMWVQDPSLCLGDTYPNAWATAINTPRTMTWADAITNCEALDYAGHNDWRLPNVKELQSILDYGKIQPAIDTTIFKNAKSSLYWSSTTFASLVFPFPSAFDVRFDAGVVEVAPKTNAFYVRPVREGL